MLLADFAVHDLHHFRLKCLKDLNEGGSSPSKIIMTKFRFAQIKRGVIVVCEGSTSSKAFLDILVLNGRLIIRRKIRSFLSLTAFPNSAYSGFWKPSVHSKAVPIEGAPEVRTG